MKTVRSPCMVIPIALGALFCVLLGGFWYVKNLLEVANPLGFVQIEFWNVTIFSGTLDLGAIVRQTSLAGMFDPTSVSDWKVLSEQVRKELSVPFVALLMTASLSSAVFKEARSLNKGYVLGLFVLLVISGYFYWTTPFSGDDARASRQGHVTWFLGQGFRYGFPFLGLLGVAAATGLSRFRIREEGLVAIVAACSILLLLGRNFLYFFVVAILTWSFRGITDWSQVRTVLFGMIHPAMIRVMAMMIVVGLLLAIGFVAQEKRAAQRKIAYDGVQEYLLENMDQHENVGYFFDQLTYVLYGKDLSRRPLYVPAGTKPLDQWLNFLAARGIGVVAVGPIVLEEWKLRKELLWLQDPEGPFYKVHGTDPLRETVLYRLK